MSDLCDLKISMCASSHSTVSLHPPPPTSQKLLKNQKAGGGEYFLIYFLDEKTVFVHMTMLGDEIKRSLFLFLGKTCSVHVHMTMLGDEIKI